MEKLLGGSSGIDLAVAEQAASEGAKIVVASSNVERIQKLLIPSRCSNFLNQAGAFDHVIFTAVQNPCGNGVGINSATSVFHLLRKWPLSKCQSEMD
jgi:NAD(P)-dependent dehydrogenase (short-subunit alcohol dehydrogenase family)